MNPRLFFALLAITFAGCASSQKKGQTAAEARGSGAVLAGEWEVPADQSDFLLFKPEPDDVKSGRFGGIADYDRYRIKGGLMFGRRITVELQSATSDTDVPSINITIDFAPDGKSLTMAKPGKGGTHTYRKVPQ
jgi:hypothetical protein